MNVIEKILAAKAGRKTVTPGQIIEVDLDYIMSNDACTVLGIEVFEKQLKATRVYDPKRVVFVLDHYTPSSSIDAANTHKAMRSFAAEQGLEHVYDADGICHQLMLEHHVSPGQVIIGADSHTCSYGALGALSTGMGSTDIAAGWMRGKTWMKVPQSIKINVSGIWPEGVYAKDLILKVIGEISASGATYKALCFSGEAVQALDVPGRITLCNMAIEAGAKFGYIAPDEKTKAYLTAKGRPSFQEFHDDEDAVYEKVMEFDVGDLVPQIAKPKTVDNVSDIGEVEGVRVDEIFLGACTNGSLEDLAVAASVLENKTIAPSVRMLVTPASREVYLQAMEAGYLETFIKSGAMVNHPGCSACFGGSGGILGEKEVLLSTANRNFKGRVGSGDSAIYLGSPATIAASAIKGEITDPRRV